MKGQSLRRVLPTGWFTDTRGVAMVTYAVVLPLFLLLIFGSLQVWKVMAVRQSLRLGTYQAARALSWQGRNLVADPCTPDRWREVAQRVAEAIIRRELERNPLAGSAVLHVSVEPPFVCDCEEVYALESRLSADALAFDVVATLGLPSPVIPFVQPVTMTLTVRHLGVLECPEDWDHRQSEPPPEGHAY